MEGQSIKKLSPQQLAQLVERSLQQGDIATAERACKRLKKLAPKSPFPHYAESRIAAARGDRDQHLASLKRCVKLQPDHRDIRFALARAYRDHDDLDSALIHLDETIRLNPDDVPARVEKADIFEHRGQCSDAEAVLAELPGDAANDPRVALVRANLAFHQGDFNRAVDLTTPTVDDAHMQTDARAGLLFVCGRAHDKLGDPGSAMAALRIAKELLAVPFDRDRFRREVDETLTFFSKERMRSLAVSSNCSDLPVFVATMPRSGSTLLDQIIDTHPLAAGAGELAYFYGVRTQLMQSQNGYPGSFAHMQVNELSAVADGYIRRIDRVRSRETVRVSDKSIENFREAGVISLVFPAARMIHLKRNAIDCCLSMFMHPFTGGLAPQTSSLRNIGFFYRQHERCMNHWKEVLDLPMLDLNYEDLVREPEREVRRTLDFCGLPWDERCLAFHESKRTTRTLSYQQVSQPIYTSSVGKAEGYHEYIGDLLDELGRTDS